MKNKKLLIWGSVAIVLLFAFVFIGKKAGWIGKDDAIEVEIAKVSKKDITEKVGASGKVQPEMEVKISPDVSGEIIELFVKEGDSVTRGQILVKIRPDNYQSLLEQAEAAVNTQKANLMQSKARLAQQKARNIKTKQDFDRNEKLFKEGVISESEFENFKSNYEVSLEETLATEQSIKASEFSVKSAEAALKDARENLRKTTIYAPASGIISKLNVEKGERVVGTSQMAGTELMRIADLRTMEVRVFVNENDIVRVDLGDTAIIEVDSYSQQGEKFKGYVTSIANSAKDAISADAVTEFEIKMRVLSSSYQHLLSGKNSVSPFRPGMTASVEIITDKKENILSVPLSAVTTRTSKELETKRKRRGAIAETSEESNEKVKKEDIFEVVFVKTADSVSVQKVKIGISDFDNIEILEGLKENDEVVSGPFKAVAKQLKSGDKVKLAVKKEKDN
jgi:HlyD family secretion protein